MAQTNAIGNNIGVSTGTSLSLTGSNSAKTFIPGYTTTAASTSTITLTVSSTENQYITGAHTQTVVLPVTSTLVLGQQYYIYNNNTGVTTVQSSGGNTVATLAANTWGLFTCILTSGTTAASWTSVTASTVPGIGTIAGNSGSVTGSSVNIQTGWASGSNAGGTFTFAGSGSTLKLNVSDTFQNTCIGANCGILSFTGATYCTALGNQALQNIGSTNSEEVAIGSGALLGDSSGSFNVAVGSASLVSLNGGNACVAIGRLTGFNYSSTESNNILIGSNVFGTTGESNVIRIGDSIGACYIGGISAVTVSASSPVCVDSNGQLSDLGFGNSGDVLTSNGAGNSPTWQPASSSSFPWSINNTSAVLTVNTGNFVNSGAVTFTLPAGTIGNTIRVSLRGGTSWTISLGGGQSIYMGALTGTTSLASTAAGDSVELVCESANNWVVQSSVGTLSLT